ncbi:ASCH domain-containing protein [Paenibacillus thermotolerans]|uniref:ASCH domain-containing protein n=1 Tax=Paenibacillus thermotolerans TaxID=3027807 RepID=UPI002367737E|nr:MULTISPECIES: ASCH domain-containing protein [unclassified Paenibacillus]
MKAITIHQPWASLIAIGAKRFETRGWKTNYRGQIAIHASKKDPHDMMQSLPNKVQRQMYSVYYNYFNIASGALSRMPTGAIVAIADLVDCRKVSDWFFSDGYPALHGQNDDFFIDENEFSFGDYTPGRYAWELANVRLIEPIPVKGQQGLWNWEGLA